MQFRNAFRRLADVPHLTEIKPTDLNSRRKSLENLMLTVLGITLWGEHLNPGSDTKGDQAEKERIRRQVNRSADLLYQKYRNMLTLFAIHYRSPWLDDGRLTVAGSSREGLASFAEGPTLTLDSCREFHRRLLRAYQAIYSRPLSFNDRMFWILSDCQKQPGPIPRSVTWLIDFPKGTEESNRVTPPALVEKGTHLTLGLPEGLIKILTSENGEDVRFNLLQHVARSSDPHLAAKPPRTLTNRLSELVETAWHKALADEVSAEAWHRLLVAFRFCKSASTPGWTPENREALAEALCFLQGLSLYQHLAPGGLMTIAAPSLGRCGHSLGAITIGSSDSGALKSELVCSEEVPTILESMLRAVEPMALRSSTKRRRLLSEVVETPGVSSAIVDTVGLSKREESTLAEVMELATKTCSLLNEQRKLRFRYVIGHAVDLARFREIYTLSAEEQRNFLRWSSEQRAHYIKAHCAHLQTPDLAVFFEWNHLVHLRIVERPKVRQVLSTPISDRSSRGDESLEQRISSAIHLTSEIDNLAVIDAGHGRIHLAYRGQTLALWDRDEAEWRNPAAEQKWITRNKLVETIVGESVDPESAKLLVEALSWVAEAPGMGCILVLAKRPALDRYLVDLNPLRLDWVSKVSLVDTDLRTLRNLLIQDGATVLNTADMTLVGQQQLVPFRENSAVRRSLKRDSLWWTYGVRRRSACDLTAASPACIAIAVSADGPITLFKRGRHVGTTAPGASA